MMPTTSVSFFQRFLPPRFPAFFWLILLVLLTIGSLSIGGCGHETQGTQVRGEQGILSIPPEGYVRIVSRRIENAPLAGETAAGETENKTNAAPEMLHYKWSIIGERNWQNPKADKNGFILGDVYPLNDTRRRGGCNIWECDLTAQSGGAGSVEWRLIVHGSNGQTATAEGTFPGDSPARAISVVQTRDEAVALPADILLARIDKNEVRLKVAQ